MAVHIRLYRMGKKKRPFYRIVAADSRRARDGRFLEVLGTYNPIEQPAKIELDEERLSARLIQGAEPSDTVHSLLSQVGFLEKFEKSQKGEDVSEIELSKTITERKKRTRKIKKAALAKAAEAEAAAKAAEETAKKEAEEKAAAADAPAEEKPAEGGE